MELREYINLLMAVIGVLMSLVGFLFWRILHRIEDKLEELHRLAHNCRESLPIRFLGRKEFDGYQSDIDKLWYAVNYHQHDQAGRVTR
ncbi:hypothetical protein [Desulfobacca acetoxidans]|nr:hypothetical protein [Desulfobacterales bacterium]